MSNFKDRQIYFISHISKLYSINLIQLIYADLPTHLPTLPQNLKQSRIGLYIEENVKDLWGLPKLLP